VNHQQFAWLGRKKRKRQFLALLLGFKSLNIDIDLLALNTSNQENALFYFVLYLIAQFNDIYTLFDSDGYIKQKIAILIELAGNKF